MGEVLSTFQRDLKEQEDDTEESQKLYDRTLYEGINIHHYYTNADHGLIHFHEAHGKNVVLSHNKTKARRREGIYQAVCFSNRPITVNQKVRIRLTDTSNDWCIALMFGFTSNDPSSITQSLLEQPIGIQKRYWLDMLQDQYAKRNYVLEFWFQSDGFIMYGANGKTIGKTSALPVKLGVPLWAVIDIVGRTVEIEFVSKELSIDTPYVPFDEDVLANFNYTARSAPPLFTADPEGNTGQIISKTAKQTCETILVGFEMATSENILINGDINMDCYIHNENAIKMKKELERESRLWKYKSSLDASRLRQLHGLLEAMEKNDYTEILKIYYRDQHQHTFNPRDKPLDIPLFIYRSQLERKWIPHVEHAIEAINEVTPGINLFETKDENESMIHIGSVHGKNPKAASTMYGSILSILENKKGKPPKKPFIHLGKDWNETQMKGSSTHELMHALSFFHEMQRSDNYMYLDIDANGDSAYEQMVFYFLTRFDPFSVMMYKEGKKMTRKKGDPIWKIKETGDRCQELSELNKVALNLIYKPCINIRKGYSPQLSIQTEMLYCGRRVMKTHNQVGISTTDGFCGPNNWANCAACRVITQIKGKGKQSITVPKLEKCLGKGKWQGLSGLFYCGKEDDTKFTTDLKHVKSDGVCGPDTGVPCTDCGQDLFNGYSIAGCDNIFKPSH